MKKIVDGILYDTTAMTKVSEDNYGDEVHTVYKTDDGKYFCHDQYYCSDGTLEREDLRDITDGYIEAEKWVESVLNR